MSNTLTRIKDEKIVAIVRLDSTEHVKEIARSLYEGGIRIIEVTLNTPGALDSIKEIKHLYEDLVIGAGTVLDAESARSAILAGADFLLAPTLSEETIRMGNRYGVPVIPGVMTPTEALAAYEYGAKMIKVFPVSSLGPNFAKDLKGPMPFLEVMAVGGVSLDNVESYLEKGWNSIGLGGSLVNNQLVKDKNYQELTNRAKQFIEVRNKVINR
ncbi:bifunctional 4-hydroxy-2-oxoglutarate aldolase/2-dehydro-3-deoxy-phosphogluconate aldolase [Halobacillus seohaensis]|uniref:Bifunctional 4-hydroxy-2-oxoglutarate aldolase/2-dehydro-3-deoxy-phosphogluconate aldolase n=1 Tax=Halobacillus seohaensis TaxID=447421 RepID=A0ABW2EJ19_9BACI